MACCFWGNASYTRAWTTRQMRLPGRQNPAVFRAELAGIKPVKRRRGRDWRKPARGQAHVFCTGVDRVKQRVCSQGHFGFLAQGVVWLNAEHLVSARKEFSGKKACSGVDIGNRAAREGHCGENPIDGLRRIGEPAGCIIVRFCGKCLFICHISTDLHCFLPIIFAGRRQNTIKTQRLPLFRQEKTPSNGRGPYLFARFVVY